MHQPHSNSRKLSFLICSVSAILMSCEPKMTMTNNSSHGENDYFEEPLSDVSKKFAVALESSNGFVELLIDGDYSALTARAAEPLSTQINEERIKEVVEATFAELGPPLEYKPMQWSFTTRTESGRDVVYSTKIVVHEKTQAYYHFRFDANGDQKKYELFHISGRRGSERIGTAVRRVFDR